MLAMWSLPLTPQRLCSAATSRAGPCIPSGLFECSLARVANTMCLQSRPPCCTACRQQAPLHNPSSAAAPSDEEPWPGISPPSRHGRARAPILHHRHGPLHAAEMLAVLSRRPRRFGGGKGGEGRTPKEPKNPSKRLAAGLSLTPGLPAPPSGASALPPPPRCPLPTSPCMACCLHAWAASGAESCLPVVVHQGASSQIHTCPQSLTFALYRAVSGGVSGDVGRQGAQKH